MCRKSANRRFDVLGGQKKQVANIAIRQPGVPEILKKPSWITSSAGELLKSDILSKGRGVRYQLYTTGCNIS